MAINKQKEYIQLDYKKIVSCKQKKYSWSRKFPPNLMKEQGSEKNNNVLNELCKILHFHQCGCYDLSKGSNMCERYDSVDASTYNYLF